MRSMIFKDDVLTFFSCRKIAQKFICLQVIIDPLKSVTLYCHGVKLLKCTYIYLCIGYDFIVSENNL